MNPSLNVRDRFQVGTELTSGDIMWGSIQTVLRLYDGRPMYRPKWAKVDKIATHWRKPVHNAQQTPADSGGKENQTPVLRAEKEDK